MKSANRRRVRQLCAFAALLNRNVSSLVRHQTRLLSSVCVYLFYAHVLLVCSLIRKGRWAQRGIRWCNLGHSWAAAWHSSPPRPGLLCAGLVNRLKFVEGRLRLWWKVGQTVGTFLWPCFCKVGKERGAGGTKNRERFSTARAHFSPRLLCLMSDSLSISVSWHAYIISPQYWQSMCKEQAAGYELVCLKNYTYKYISEASGVVFENISILFWKSQAGSDIGGGCMVSRALGKQWIPN